jgi:hypothetical protein
MRTFITLLTASVRNNALFHAQRWQRSLNSELDKIILKAAIQWSN